jgi:hypothetical protein
MKWWGTQFWKEKRNVNKVLVGKPEGKRPRHPVCPSVTQYQRLNLSLDFMNFGIEVLCKTLSDKCVLSSVRLSESRTYLGVCFPNLLNDLGEIRHRSCEYNHVWHLWVLLKYVQLKAFFAYGNKFNCTGISILFAQFGKNSVKEMLKLHFSSGQSTALFLSSIWYLPTYLLTSIKYPFIFLNICTRSKSSDVLTYT